MNKHKLFPKTALTEWYVYCMETLLPMTLKLNSYLMLWMVNV